MKNDRIKELLSQALDTAVPETWTALTPEQLVKVSEKFAELIVQECANFVREEYDHEHAEGIAWYMEIKFGLHGDYA